MAFDKNMDKQLFTESAEWETTRINVGVYSYNDGEKKIQLSRENRNQDGEWSFAKLGRMTKEEAEKIMPLMKKALENM
jgi:hypothetical protein